MVAGSEPHEGPLALELEGFSWRIFCILNIHHPDFSLYLFSDLRRARRRLWFYELSFSERKRARYERSG